MLEPTSDCHWGQAVARNLHLRGALVMNIFLPSDEFFFITFFSPIKKKKISSKREKNWSNFFLYLPKVLRF